MIPLNYLRPPFFCDQRGVKRPYGARCDLGAFANLGRRFDSLVTPHPCLLGLGEDPPSRIAAYREWLHAREDQDELQSIRAHVTQQRAYEDTRFQAMVERTLNRPAALRPPGRPATLGPDQA